jgi:pSer/pThr/pTyr-binding forkhead associated (FHA) protein
MLSRKVKYAMNEKNITIGRKQADPPNDIIIGGVGILTHHAIIFKC